MTSISDMMRSSISSYLPLAAAVIVLLVLSAMEAEGTRLDSEPRASVSSGGGGNPVLNVSSDSDLLFRCLNLWMSLSVDANQPTCVAQCRNQ